MRFKKKHGSTSGILLAGIECSLNWGSKVLFCYHQTFCKCSSLKTILGTKLGCTKIGNGQDLA